MQVIHKNLLMIGFCALLLVAGGCKKEEVATKSVRPVKVLQLRGNAEDEQRIFAGKVAAAKEVMLAFRVAGQIHQFPVVVGQFAAAGAKLAQLDTYDYGLAVRGYEAQLQGAKAALQEATLQHGRYAQLLQEKTASQAAYDSADSAFKRAKAQVAALTEQLSKARADYAYTSIKAPFDGYVAEKYADNFQTVAAGQPIVKFQSVRELDVSVSVPDVLMPRMKDVRSVSIALAAFPNQTFEARVHEVATDASLRTRTYPVTVRFTRPQNMNILPGMAADVQFVFVAQERGVAKTANSVQHDQTAEYTLPETALFRDDNGNTRVWIFTPRINSGTAVALAGQGTVKSQIVTVARMNEVGVVVRGLNEGAHIVIAGVQYLQEEQEVRLLQEEGNNSSTQGVSSVSGEVRP